jgi:hypothetical protein
MLTNEPQRIASASARKNRASLVVSLCIIWVVASVIGFGIKAFAATPTVLRGAQTGPSTISARPTRTAPKTALRAEITPEAWLGTSVWRAGPCESLQNFQTFSFMTEPKVEVGNGKPGDGERLQLLRVSTDSTGLIQIETRVCAPVGCNQTIERYKKIGANQMQEWHFEGRLPDHVPYVIVANGTAVDGSGPGRIFNRCPV